MPSVRVARERARTQHWRALRHDAVDAHRRSLPSHTVVPVAVRALLSLGLAALASCGDSAPTKPASAFPVAVQLWSGTPAPGSDVQYRVTASPASGETVQYIGLGITGVVAQRDSVMVAAGNRTVVFNVHVPYMFGDLNLTAFARTTRGAVGYATMTSVSGDAGPPSPGFYAVTPAAGSTLDPGSVLTVFFGSTDDVSLRYVLLRLTGALTQVDQVDYPAWGTTSGGKTVHVIVPSAVGQTITMMVEAKDFAGKVASVSLPPMRIVDASPPQLSLAVRGGSASGVFQPTDTLRLDLSATDNASLKYVGYAIDGPFGVRDSTPASGTAYARTVSIPVAGRNGAAVVTLFGADSTGNATQVPVIRLGFGARPRQAVSLVTLAGVSEVTDIAYDSKRDVAYLAQSMDSRVAVVSRGAATEGAAIMLTGQPTSVDVTVGGDTLVIAYADRNELGLVNLTTGMLGHVALDSLRVSSQVRAMANGHALVALYTPNLSGGAAGLVADIDLATGQKVGSLVVTERTPLVRSLDRRRLLALIDNSCCWEVGVTYDVATGTFMPSVPISDHLHPSLATGLDGSRFLVDERMFDASLNSLGYFVRPLGATIQAGGPDPATAFVVVPGALARVRLSTSAVIERIALPFTPLQLVITPDGLTAIAANGNRLAIIDLW